MCVNYIAVIENHSKRVFTGKRQKKMDWMSQLNAVCVHSHCKGWCNTVRINTERVNSTLNKSIQQCRSQLNTVWVDSYCAGQFITVWVNSDGMSQLNIEGFNSHCTSRFYTVRVDFNTEWIDTDCIKSHCKSCKIGKKPVKKREKYLNLSYRDNSTATRYINPKASTMIMTENINHISYFIKKIFFGNYMLNKHLQLID